MPLLCIPVKSKTIPELKRVIKKASSKADAFEIWIDHLPSDLRLRDLKSITGKPLIIVNKGKRERGLWKGNEETRIKLLIDYIKDGADFVDVDLATPEKYIKRIVNAAKNHKTKVIISYHNFTKTPGEEALVNKAKKAYRLGADIIKIATKASHPRDNLNVLNLLQYDTNRIAVMCMGKHGKLSRICGPLMGSCLNFMAIDGQHKTATGQLTLDEYKKILQILKK